MTSRFLARAGRRMKLPFTERETGKNNRVGWVGSKEKGRVVADIKNLSLTCCAFGTCWVFIGDVVWADIIRVSCLGRDLGQGRSFGSGQRGNAITSCQMPCTG